MLVRVKKHPTLGVLVASNGMVFNRIRHSHYKWTFGNVSGRYAIVKIDGKHYHVHRLVAETFLLNPEGKPQVDHILRDPYDNNVCQIKWATPSENCRNKDNNLGIANLLDIDKNTYQKAWYNLHAEKQSEYQRQWYRKKREAGFHIVKDEYGKQHWEKI